MSSPAYEKIANTVFLIVGVTIALILAHAILLHQQAEIAEYCTTLINNGTITNISECNMTSLAMEAPL